MQGLILAAGMGKRLKELTQDNTKCMLEVNGVRLIDRVLGQLAKLGLKRTVLVTDLQPWKTGLTCFPRMYNMRMKTMTMASANGGEPILIEKILDSELGDKCGLFARVTISATSTTPSATSRLSSWC